MNIAVFASGRGSNFAAIIKAARSGKIRAKIGLLVCDNPSAGVLAKAKRAKIKIALIKRGDFTSKQEFEAKIIDSLRENKIELIVLAGFMRMLSAEFVSNFKNKIINIHPALLPAFKGSHGIADAFEYGVKVTGVTVHFVDEKMDHGPIILQQALNVEISDTVDTLEAKMHKLEHQLYPKTINLLAKGKVKITGRKVKITSR